MWSPKKILVPTDFSEDANRAAHYAAALSGHFGSEVTLLHVVSVFWHHEDYLYQNFPELENAYKAIEKDARKRMQKHKHTLNAAKCREVVVRGASVAEEILFYAVDHDVDLIVMGTHGRTGVGHFLLGSVAERMIRNLECPVMTIKYAHGKKDVDPEFRRILVPLDFSKYSEAALDPAVSLAKKFNAELQFVHVVEDIVNPAYYAIGEQSLFDINPEIREKSLSMMQDIARQTVPKAIKSRFHVLEGKAHTEIVKYAEEQAIDLIVMAAHGHGGLEQLLIGSTTEKVARKSRVPVLSVKSQEKE